MFNAAPMALGALALVTACAPQPPVRTSQEVPPPRPVDDPAALLTRLALDVPEEIAAHASPIGAAGGPLAAAPAFEAGAQDAIDAARALDCLTAAVYHEARSEPLEGGRAVAQVVLNRVRDRAFPRTICGVVYQGATRRTGCQFSFTCDGSLRAARDPQAWERALSVAASALGGAVYAPVGSATHYHADYVSPWWAPSLSRIGAVGRHVFYRWRGGMEHALTFRQRYAGGEPVLADATIAAAVTVHRGGTAESAPEHPSDEQPFGVTVHRAGEATARPVSFGGVRIHRDVTTPDDADQPGAAVEGQSEPA